MSDTDKVFKIDNAGRIFQQESKWIPLINAGEKLKRWSMAENKMEKLFEVDIQNFKFNVLYGINSGVWIYAYIHFIPLKCYWAPDPNGNLIPAKHGARGALHRPLNELERFPVDSLWDYKYGVIFAYEHRTKYCYLRGMDDESKPTQLIPCANTYNDSGRLCLNNDVNNISSSATNAIEIVDKKFKSFLEDDNNNDLFPDMNLFVFDPVEKRFITQKLSLPTVQPLWK